MKLVSILTNVHISFKRRTVLHFTKIVGDTEMYINIYRCVSLLLVTFNLSFEANNLEKKKKDFT